MLVAVDGCPAPVVAWIQGYCLGGGCGLAACVDIAVAADDAVFGFSEVKLGIIPAVISPFVLAKIGSGSRAPVLPDRASGSSRTSRSASASSARSARASTPWSTSSSRPARAPCARRSSLVRPEPGDGRALAELAARMRTSDEGQDGLRAFLERRKPGWID